MYTPKDVKPEDRRIIELEAEVRFLRQELTQERLKNKTSMWSAPSYPNTAWPYIGSPDVAL